VFPTSTRLFPSGTILVWPFLLLSIVGHWTALLDLSPHLNFVSLRPQFCRPPLSVRLSRHLSVTGITFLPFFLSLYVTTGVSVSLLPPSGDFSTVRHPVPSFPLKTALARPHQIAVLTTGACLSVFLLNSAPPMPVNGHAIFFFFLLCKTPFRSTRMVIL